MVPMTYAAVAGIAGWRRMRFVNRVHKLAVRAAIVYITVSVPLHIYVGLVLNDIACTCASPGTGSATCC